MHYYVLRLSTIVLHYYVLVLGVQAVGTLLLLFRLFFGFIFNPLKVFITKHEPSSHCSRFSPLPRPQNMRYCTHSWRYNHQVGVLAQGLWGLEQGFIGGPRSRFLIFFYVDWTFAVHLFDSEAQLFVFVTGRVPTATLLILANLYSIRLIESIIH